MENFSIPEGFDRIWARVTEHSEHQEVPLTLCQELEKFMRGEEQSIAFYRDMIRRCKGTQRQTMLKILADERRHLKSLQLEYFMETGDTFVSSESGLAKHSGMLSSLREGFVAETNTTASYAAAAKNRSGELAAMYTSIAEDEARHAQLLRDAIGRSFKEQG